jgi:hypothetical protein
MTLPYHPIPACKMVATTWPPTLDLAFIVSLIAQTGVVEAAYWVSRDPTTAAKRRSPASSRTARHSGGVYASARIG